MIESLSESSPAPWCGIYPATKAAVHMLMDILYMECRPLGINTTLVAAGGVKSNIVNNAKRPDIVPENTVYPTYTSQIVNLFTSGQTTMHTISTQEFADKVAKGTMVKNPPRFMLIGRGSILFWILGWLPRAWALTIMWWVVTRMY